MNTTFFVFAGLPGTGKSELSSRLAGATASVYLRVDSIEQAIRRDGGSLRGPEGYEVAYAVARDNLSQGKSVVVDCVNPIRLTRECFISVAVECGVSWFGIEIVCSDEIEHRRRVESRTSSIPGFVLPTWEQVSSREYESWGEAEIVLDTSGETAADSWSRLWALLNPPTEWETSPISRS